MQRQLEQDATLVVLLFTVGCFAALCYYGWPAIVAWILGLLLTSYVVKFYSGRV